MSIDVNTESWSPKVVNYVEQHRNNSTKVLGREEDDVRPLNEIQVDIVNQFPFPNSSTVDIQRDSNTLESLCLGACSQCREFGIL